MKVATNLEKITGPNTEYELLIKYENASYQSKTVSIKNLDANTATPIFSSEDLYNAAFSQKDFSNEKNINVEIKTFGEHFKLDKQIQIRNNEVIALSTDKNLSASYINKEMSLKGNSPEKVMTEVCIDWYLIVDEYDYQGNLTDHSVTYLGRDCFSDEQMINWIQPGESGPEYDDGTIHWGQGVEIKIGQDAAENGIGGDKKILVKWYCYDAGAIKFKSYERITVSTLISPSITGLQHISMLTEGVLQDQTSEPQLAAWEDRSDDYTARIKLTFKDKRTITKNNHILTKYSLDFTQGQVWHVEDLIY